MARRKLIEATESVSCDNQAYSAWELRAGKGYRKSRACKRLQHRLTNVHFDIEVDTEKGSYRILRACDYSNRKQMLVPLEAVMDQLSEAEQLALQVASVEGKGGPEDHQKLAAAVMALTEYLREQQEHHA